MDKKVVSSVSRVLKDLFFPIFCVGCGREGCFVCEACEGKIPQFVSPWHEHEKFPFLKSVCAPFPYKEGEVLAKLIQVFKYQFAHEAHESLMKIMAPVLRENKAFFEGGLLVSVPLHKKRKRWRGFNQAEILAEDFSKILEIPVASLLCRVRDTKPQAELNRENRLTNVRDAFDVHILPRVMPKKIFLVDDVMSTGSTMRECAKALRKYFICEINAVVLATP